MYMRELGFLLSKPIKVKKKQSKLRVQVSGMISYDICSNITCAYIEPQ